MIRINSLQCQEHFCGITTTPSRIPRGYSIGVAVYNLGFQCKWTGQRSSLRWSPKLSGASLPRAARSHGKWRGKPVFTRVRLAGPHPRLPQLRVQHPELRPVLGLSPGRTEKEALQSCWPRGKAQASAWLGAQQPDAGRGAGPCPCQSNGWVSCRFVHTHACTREQTYA